MWLKKKQTHNYLKHFCNITTEPEDFFFFFLKYVYFLHITSELKEQKHIRRTSVEVELGEELEYSGYFQVN